MKIISGSIALKLGRLACKPAVASSILVEVT